MNLNRSVWFSSENMQVIVDECAKTGKKFNAVVNDCVRLALLGDVTPIEKKVAHPKKADVSSVEPVKPVKLTEMQRIMAEKEQARIEAEKDLFYIDENGLRRRKK